MISNLTDINPDAKIAGNVKIDSFSSVHGDVVIGEGTWIGSNVTIYDGARIGKNCRIFPGAVISAIPQDLKYEGEITQTIIGDNTTIREFVTINKGTVAAGKTTIGNNCLLMAYVHVAHDCNVGNNAILANGVTLAGHIDLEEYAIIGGLSAIHQFVKIGSHVMVSGGSLIRKDVPPYVMAAREPLSYSGINSVGLRRRGYSNKQIENIQNIYRSVFTKGLNIKKAIEIVENEIDDSTEKTVILKFINEATRGLIKGYTPGGNDGSD
jgi:UDP-N-acetylglucosamine acyltransferase